MDKGTKENNAPQRLDKGSIVVMIETKALNMWLIKPMLQKSLLAAVSSMKFMQDNI